MNIRKNIRNRLKLECEQRREFEQLERDMQHESPETGATWYDEGFGMLAYEMGVRHGYAMRQNDEEIRL